MSRDREVADARKGASALAPGRRWSVARGPEVVMRWLRGEPLDQGAHELGVEGARLERWPRWTRGCGSAATRRSSANSRRPERASEMLSMQNELPWKRVERERPFPRRRSRR